MCLSVFGISYLCFLEYIYFVSKNGRRNNKPANFPNQYMLETTFQLDVDNLSDDEK